MSSESNHSYRFKSFRLDVEDRHLLNNDAPVPVVEEALRLYREEYYDLNVRHYHEKLVEKHSIGISYTWVKNLLQGAGLKCARKRTYTT